MEKSYSQDIEKYAVKIKDTLIGSGVLVKVNEETTYLITAKHNFKKDKNETYQSVKVLELEKRLDKISITKDREENICTIKSIVYEESELDLIVFSVTTDSCYIKNLPILNILKDDYPLKEYFFYGYPNDERGTPIEELKRPSYYETEKYIFRLDGHKGQKEKHLQGFSGSGLFTEYDDIIYLVGIVIKVDDKLFHYECIDLSKIIDSINQNLNVSIPIKKDVVDVGFSQNIYTRILNRNKNTYLVKRLLTELKEEKSLKFLKDNYPTRKKIIEFLDMDENHLLELEKELADLYLLKAIIYHSDENDKKNKYFKKAKKFNDRYKNYQLEKLDDIEDKNIDEIENSEDFTPLQKAKLYIIEEKYNKVIEILTTEYIEELERLEKIESYECLAKAHNELDNFKASIGFLYTIREDLLEKTQILEKAELSYRLSLSYEKLNDKEEALNMIIEGLDFLDENKENKFLEIRYKLEKQKRKLSNSTEKRENLTLTELFKQNPERYLDEYLENLRSNTIDITNRDILDEIKVIQRQIRINEKKH